MVELTDYIRKRGISKKLELKVKNYFKYLHDENEQQFEKVFF